MWLICGLGNPGIKYDLTRHNIGFDIINHLATFNNCQLVKKDNDVELYKTIIGSEECFLCKPLTFMNLSGKPIGKLKRFYKIPISKIIVIHDDLDLEVNKVKIKIGGGNAGHNGLSNIDQIIGSDYKRLRVGIGHPGNKSMVSSYVLEKFSIEDKELIDNKLLQITKYFHLIFNYDRLFLTKITS